MSENYQKFLDWLSPDRSGADDAYLCLRNGLIRYFVAKGCSDPEMLSDETINRVVLRLSDGLAVEAPDRIRFIFGFAKNINYEDRRQTRAAPMSLNERLVGERSPSGAVEENEHRYECLDRCIQRLNGEDGKMILEYFGMPNKGRRSARRSMASRLNISTGNLHIKVFRAKVDLRECVTRCIEKML